MAVWRSGWPGAWTPASLGWKALAVASVVVLALLIAWLLQASIPRQLVFASGHLAGQPHEYAQRYRAILARDGVRLEARATEGMQANARLLADAGSGVDVAIVQGGNLAGLQDSGLVMLAALYYEPLWVFYRGEATLDRLDQLRGLRVAAGLPDSSVHAFAMPLLEANAVTADNTRLDPRLHLEALEALRRGEIDAALMLGPVASPAIRQALHDPSLKLMSFSRAAAYPRRYPHIAALSLPEGAIDLAANLPAREVQLIGTKVMLVAREGLSAAVMQLLLRATREVHTAPGYFEAPGEFPNARTVVLPVPELATRYFRDGPGLLQRHLPWYVAAYVERVVVVLVPLLIVLVPLINLVPALWRWRTRSRITRLYGELRRQERRGLGDGAEALEAALEAVARIETAAATLNLPEGYAAEVYALRSHARLVREALLAARN